ncbi:hypothetical protein NHQ30_000050 [Ciborinia camelliae]|nr:hypothetical protein NHQ30_000050 [Ciborinia camelliae]
MRIQDLIGVPTPIDIDYGDVGPVLNPLPLNMGCAMENQPLTTDTILFKLPIEILQWILDLFCPKGKDLASFALVNREFRQLARSRQFAVVRFDFTPHSLAMIDLLYEEGIRRKSDNGAIHFLSLGACIGSITVNLHKYFQQQLPQRVKRRLESPSHQDDKFGVLTAASSGNGESKEEDFLPENAIRLDRHMHDYFLRLRKVLGSPWTLPYLQTLKWNIDYYIDTKLFQALVSPTTRNLILFDINVDEVHLSHPLPAFPLRTLIVRAHQTNMEGKTDGLCITLLRKCASTLGCLVWHGDIAIDRSTPADSLLDFPRLKSLYLRDENPNTSIVNALLKSKVLENLRIDFFMPSNVAARSLLDTHGRIETLNTFSFSNPPMEFLKANDQLSHINFDSARVGYNCTIDCQNVLRILSTFSNLTSLAIHFRKHRKGFPIDSLKLIGRLTTLNQLLISNYVEPFAPITDHKVILTALHPLKSLERLVIQGDLYVTDLNQGRPDQYYNARHAIDGEPFNPSMSEEAIRKAKTDPQAGGLYWLKRHQLMLFPIACRYFHSFGQLKLLFVGKSPIFRRGTKVRFDMLYQENIGFYTGEMFQMMPWDRLSENWTSYL